MWACRHAATFLPETPFSGETEIMSGIYQKKYFEIKRSGYLLSGDESKRLNMICFLQGSVKIHNSVIACVWRGGGFTGLTCRAVLILCGVNYWTRPFICQLGYTAR